MWNTIADFFKKLLLLDFFKSFFSKSGEVEPKYVIGFIGMIYLGVMIYYHLTNHFNVQRDLIIAAVLIVLGCFSIDILPILKSLGIKGDVASNMVNSDASKQSNDAAKEVTLSDKPTISKS